MKSAFRCACFLAVALACAAPAPDARAQFKKGANIPPNFEYGFQPGRKVFYEGVYRLGGDPKAKMEVLSPLVGNKEKSVVVYTRQTGDSTFKLISALDAKGDALKDCPVHVVFLFADRKPLDEKAAKVKNVSLFLSNRKGPEDWGIFDIDPKLETMVFLVERGTIKTKLEVMEGKATDARVDELAKAVFGYAAPAPGTPAGIKDRLTGHPGGARSMVFGPDGKHLYTHGTQRDSGEETRVSKWNLATGKEEANVAAHLHGGRCLDLTRDGALLISAGPDREVKLWDPATLKLLDTIKTAMPPYALRISPDQKTFAVGGGMFSDHPIQIFDLKTKKELRTLKGHGDRVRALDFSPDGKRLVSGDEEGKIKLWDVAEGKELAGWAGHTKAIECVAFSPDGKWIASGGDMRRADPARAQLWNAETRKEVRELESTNVMSVTGVAFLPGGKKLAVAGHSHYVHVIDLETGKIVAERDCERSIVLSLALSRDGTTVAAGLWHQTIRLWDVKDKK